MKPVVTGADIHGIHEFEKGSIDDAGYGNPMFLAIYGFHFYVIMQTKKVRLKSLFLSCAFFV